MATTAPRRPAAVRVRREVGTASAPVRRSEADRFASQVLLAIARMLRGFRREHHAPHRIDALLHSGQLAPRHLGVFALIALDGPLTVSELAAEGVALSTASLLVTQLADSGLVDRSEDAGDRRRTVVSVAPAHRAESEAVLQAKLDPLRRALDRLGGERAKLFLEALWVVAEEVDRSSQDPRSAAKGDAAGAGARIGQGTEVRGDHRARGRNGTSSDEREPAR